MTDKTPLKTARDQVEQRIDVIVEAARSRANQAADQVSGTKKPVKTLADAGVRLSKISHKTTDKLIKHQAKILSHSIDAVAGRFQAAADANNVKDLVTTQVRLVPENASRLASDTRDAFDIVLGAGAEARDILASTLAELRGKAEKPARRTARKTATRKKAAKPATSEAAAEAA